MNILLLVRGSRSLPTARSSTGRIGLHEEAAMRLGIRLRNGFPGARLIALAAGDASEDAVLRDAMARGADRACRLWDPLLAEVDALGVARALGAAASHLGFDLVLTGARSPDECLGFMGPALGEALAIPHLADVLDLSWDEAQLAVVAERCAATRRFRHILPLPCLITVQGSSEEALPANAEATTDRAPEVLSLADVGMEEAILRPRCRLSGELRPYSAPPYVTAWAEDASTVVEHLRDLDLL